MSNEVAASTAPPANLRPVADGDIDFWKLLHSIWEGRWVILGVAFAAGVIATLISLRIPNEYRAVVLLTPAASTGGGALSQIAGQFGGLAAITGIGLGGNDENEKTIVGMELLKSWSFQEKFVRDNHLELAVVAAKGWNPASERLVIDGDLYDVDQKRWTGRFHSAKGIVPKPTGWDLHQALSRRVAISLDKKTNLVTLSVEYYSPYLARDWAEKLVVAVNRHIQERDRAEARKNLAYLEAKMTQTGLTEMKTVFSRLIEEETKKLMLADVSDEYVFRTLSPAESPEVKISPKRALIVLTSVVLAGIAAIVGWLVFLNFRAYRRGVWS